MGFLVFKPLLPLFYGDNSTFVEHFRMKLTKWTIIPNIRGKTIEMSVGKQAIINKPQTINP